MFAAAGVSRFPSRAWCFSFVIAMVSLIAAPRAAAIPAPSDQLWSNVCTPTALNQTLSAGPAMLTPGRYMSAARAGHGWDFFWSSAPTPTCTGGNCTPNEASPRDLFVAFYTFRAVAAGGGNYAWRPIWYAGTGSLSPDGKSFTGNLRELSQIDRSVAESGTFAGSGKTVVKDTNIRGILNLAFRPDGATGPDAVAVEWSLDSTALGPGQTSTGVHRDCLRNFRGLATSEQSGQPINGRSGAWGPASAQGWLDMAYFYENFEQHVLLYFEKNGTSSAEGTPRWLHAMVPQGTESTLPATHACRMPNQAPVPALAEPPGQTWRHLCLMTVRGYDPYKTAATENWSWDNSTNKSQIRLGWLSHTINSEGALQRAQINVTRDPPRSFVNVLPAELKVDPRGIESEADAPLITLTDIQQYNNVSRVAVIDELTAAPVADRCNVGGTGSAHVAQCKLRLHWYTDSEYANVAVYRARVTTADAERLLLARNTTRTASGGVPQQIGMPGDQYAIELWSDVDRRELLAKSTLFTVTGKVRSASCAPLSAGMQPVARTPTGTVARPGASLVFTYDNATHACVGDVRVQVMRKLPNGTWLVVAEQVVARSGYPERTFTVTDVASLGDLTAEFKWRVAAYDAAGIFGTASEQAFRFSAPEIPDVAPVGLAPMSQDLVAPPGGSGGVDGGAATYTLPIRVAPGRNGMQPSLSLNYSSRAGNGIAGMGWSLSGLSSVHRCARTLAQDNVSATVQFTADDALCLDEQRLAYIANTGSGRGTVGAQYRTELESYTRVTQMGGSLANNSATVWFKAETASNEIIEYGNGNGSALVPAFATAPTANHTLSWAISRRADRSGNAVHFLYDVIAANGEQTLREIQYAGALNDPNNRKVSFTYDTRPSSGTGNDVSSSYVGGGLTMSTRRLIGIRSSAPGTTATFAYTLEYAVSTTSGRSLLRRIVPSASGQGLPPIDVSWNEGAIAHRTTRTIDPASVLNASYGPQPIMPLPGPVPPGETPPDPFPAIATALGGERIARAPDFDGDGRREAVFTAVGGRSFLLSFGTDGSIRSAAELVMSAVDIARLSSPHNIDFDNDGRADLVRRSNTSDAAFATISFWKGTGSSLPVDLTNFETFTTTVPAGTRNVQVMDFDGDGLTDFLVHEVLSGSPCLLRLTAYLNRGGTNPRQPSFAPQQIGCLNSNTTRGLVSVSRYDDFDGNGLPDIWYEQTGDAGATAKRRVLLAERKVDGTLAYADIDLDTRIASGGNAGGVSDIWTADVQRWVDVNADGLLDIAYSVVKPTGLNWALRINAGGRFGPGILTGGSSTDGLNFNKVSGPEGSSLAVARYLDALNPADLDADGRAELLYPMRLALPVCVLQPPRRGGLPPTPGPAIDAPLPGEYEFTLRCPGEVDGSWPYDVLVGGVETLPLYWAGGLPASLDFSAYQMNALHFVQTGPASYEVRSRPTEVVTRINGGEPDDYFGDGLDDVHSSVGCPLATPATWPPVGNEPPVPYTGAPSCEIPPSRKDGTAWPLIATLGTTAAEQSAAIQDLRRRVRLFTSRHRGVLTGGAERAIAPLLPDMVARVSWTLPGSTWGSNPVDAVEWDYYPLAATLPTGAARKLPLYTIPSRSSNNGYVDSEHFYFSSSMPVVSAMRQSSGVGPALSDMIERVYSYSEAMYHNRGRGFRGFRSIVEWNRATTLYSGTVFEQKFPYAGVAICSATGVDPKGLWCPNGASASGKLAPSSASASAAALSGATSPLPEVTPVTDAIDATETYWDAPSTCAGAPGSIDARVACRHVRPYYTSSLRRDPSNGERVWASDTEHSYDAFGNVSEETNVVSDSVGALPSYTVTRIVSSRYDTSAARDGEWWRNKLQSRTTRQLAAYRAEHMLPAGVTAPGWRNTTQLYDYDGAATRRPNCEALFETDAPGTTSCAFTEAAGAAAPTNFVSRTRTTYDATFGYPRAVTRDARVSSGSAWVMSPTRVTKVEHDATGYFPARLTNAADHVSLASGFNALTGTTGSTTDANNLTTSTTYNALGQPLAVTFPSNADGTSARPSDTTYQWCKAGKVCGTLTEALYRVVARQEGTPTTVTYHDRRGRVIRTETQGLNAGDWFATETEFSALGDRIRDAGPNYGGPDGGGSVRLPLTLYSDFDVLRRPTRKEQVRNDLDPPPGYTGGVSLITTYAYAGTTTTINVRADRGATASLEPTLTMERTIATDGTLLATRDAKGGITRFWYDGAGNPVLINPVNDQRLVATCNHVGERIAVSDPARGAWTFTYNGFGELTGQRDARGFESTYAFDALGRTTARTYWEESPPGTQRWFTDEWHYDTDAGGAARRGALGIVKRTRTTSNGGAVPAADMQSFQRRYSYDTLMRPVRDEMQFNRPGNAQVELMTSTKGYDRNFGRLKTEVLPGLEPIYHLYSETGLAKETGDPSFFYSLAGGNGYYERIAEINPFGVPKSVLLKASVLGPGGWARVDHYDASTGLRTRTVDGNVLDLTYRYDAYGNLREQRDTLNAAGMRERYDFDELHRLKSATRYVAASTTATGATTYQYDAAGNLLTKTDFSTVGGYTYNGNRVTAVTLASAPLTPLQFTYDANGNITHRLVGGVGRVLHYDIDNLPIAVLETTASGGASTNGSSFRYAPDGSRYAQTIARPGSTQRQLFYFDKRYEKEIGQDGTIERWYLPGGAMKIKSTAPTVASGLYYAHGDHLNSSSALVDPTADIANKTERRAFDAFGHPRDWATWSQTNNAQLFTQSTASPKNRRGFTQHEHIDNSNLIHMNGRVYDANLGRFYGVDPFIQFPANSQSLNPYSYILNNPLSGTDPSGYESEGVNSGCTPMAGSHVCGVDTGARGGVSTRTIVTTGDDGRKFRVKEIISGTGPRHFTDKGAGNGAISSVSPAGPARNGGGQNDTAEILTGDERDRMRTGLGVVKDGLDGAGEAIDPCPGSTSCAGQIVVLAVAGATVRYLYYKVGGRILRREAASKVESIYDDGPGVGISKQEMSTIKQETNERVARGTDVASPTAGRPVDASTRQRILARDREADGSWTCATCGQRTANPSNVHTGHIQPRSRGGDLSDSNLRCEGAACNLSQGNRRAPSPGRTCAERGSCGAPYGRTD